MEWYGGWQALREYVRLLSLPITDQMMAAHGLAACRELRRTTPYEPASPKQSKRLSAWQGAWLAGHRQCVWLQQLRA